MDKPMRKFHLLVVDDDESMRFMLQSKLVQSGFDVTLATSGQHAIDILQTFPSFDLILCDLRMPLKGGVEVMRFNQENKNHIPAIIFTGFPEREKIIAAAEHGVKDVLVKPVRHQDLIQMIMVKLGTQIEDKTKAA